MRLLSRALCAVVVVVAITSCGGSETTATNDGRTTPATGGNPRAFPVTITRTGGIAGFQDVLAVADNGLVSVARKGQQPRKCQLTPRAVERLTAAASRVPWTRLTPASTQPSFPDDLVSLVQSPAGGPFRLEDPGLGAAGQSFIDLLNDLSGAPDASRMCRPR